MSFTITEHSIDCQYVRHYPRATSAQDAPLKLLLKKYTPVDNQNPQPGDVTLIGVPGTGLPKELYEPLWEELLARSRHDGFRIRAIWMADVANQGASGVYNEKHLGNDPSWHDHSRDLLHMINHFRAEMPRPIMGIGHSAGAVQQIFLSLMHPRLFTSLILIEPYLYPVDTGEGGRWILARARQSDSWDSLSKAAAISQNNYGAWDPRVFERWVQHGFRDLPTALHPATETETEINKGAVALTTTIPQEVFMYARPNSQRHKQLGLPAEEDNNDDDGPSPAHDPLVVPDMIGGLYRKQRFYRPEPILAWRLLPHLQPSALYLSGAMSGLSLAGGQAQAAERTGTGFGGSGGAPCHRVKHVVVERAGHTLPMEKVGETAAAMGLWIAEELQRWREEERRIEDGWRGLSVKEKSGLSTEWERLLQIAAVELPRRNRSNKSKL
ncbi:alpha/beta-hydrolase [Aspergillus cavernicola]|uniref:Alpha/beta-hydrolase n=1 Tax=Aspergillus cavernicola TaxID=176166 RepID=A0ABR4I655_9EURO